MSFALDSVQELTVHGPTSEVVEVAGGSALKLEGLVLVPELELSDLRVEVEILAEQACYPGVVFRFADLTSYELAYAVPHASGQPDALQYDPVINGSNTWQLHTGPAYQQRAELAMGEWFTLRVDVQGTRAVVQVDDQPPLIVESLSHEVRQGQVGLWSYRPALLRNLRVTSPRSIDQLVGVSPESPPSTITEWRLEGVGTVACDPSGVLNLSRFMAPDDQQAQLSRRFEVGSASEIELGLGYSDVLELRLDGELVHSGSWTFKGFESLSDRGWVEIGSEPARIEVEAGVHELAATLERTEPFGWGLIATLSGPDLRLLPLSEAAHEGDAP